MTVVLGLSTLLAWIRCTSGISLKIGKWQARGDNKQVITERKNHSSGLSGLAVDVDSLKDYCYETKHVR